MTPGDPSIRKVFDKICPRIGGEQIPAWLSRVARRLGWPAARVTSLYKDQRCRLSDKEGHHLRNVLRNHESPRVSAGQTPPSNQQSNHERLREARKRDEDVNILIKDIADDITHTAIRQLGETLLAFSPRVTR